MTLPNKFIVSKKPDEYLEQGISHCGMYAAKAVLESFGLDNKNRPQDYHDTWFYRLTGIANLNKLMELFHTYEVPATLGVKKGLSDEQKLLFLKEKLSEDKPLMMRIGNGYRRNGKYSEVRSHIPGHWITLWGYDDSEKIFYIYDSCIPISRHMKNIPIGNTKRSYVNVLRDWGKWTLRFSIKKNIYISF